MTSGGSVNDDQVKLTGSLKLFDLPEDQNIADAWNCGGDNIECPRRDESAGDALQAVILEVVQQGIFWQNRSGPDPAYT
ncbi:unannotated protein [freshwater metagenome]|uniref:Unannotated protein n=1 Tax=freshwater metagenome TaxID=449393 RepID=A0A6J7UST9_9ZZZZ